MSDEHEDIDALFGSLRSALHAREYDDLVTLVRAAHHMDASRYHTQWVPYLRGFLGEGDICVGRPVRALDELEALATCLPFPCMRLVLSVRHLDTSQVKEFARLEALESVTQLVMDGCTIKKRGIRDLARTPHLLNLRALTLRKNGLGIQECITLFGKLELAHLLHLTLTDNVIGEHGMRQLVESMHAGPLQTLICEGTELWDAGASVLFASELCSQLRVLKLPRNFLTDHCLESIARATSFASLRQLDLSSNGFTPQGMRDLFKGVEMPQLRVIDLQTVHMKEMGARELSRADFVPRIEELDLSRARVGIAGFRHLFDASVDWRKLRVLRLAHTSFNDSALDVLLGSTAFTRLEELDVRSASLSVQGVMRLVADPRCASLRKLSLSYQGSDKATRALAESPHLRGLQELDISSTWLSPVAYRALKESSCLSQRVRDSL